jgi:hypothetical protein
MKKITDKIISDVLQTIQDGRTVFNFHGIKEELKSKGYEIEEPKSLIEEFNAVRVEVKQFNDINYVREWDYSQLYDLSRKIQNDLLKQITNFKTSDDIKSLDNICRKTTSGHFLYFFNFSQTVSDTSLINTLIVYCNEILQEREFNIAHIQNKILYFIEKENIQNVIANVNNIGIQFNRIGK